MYFDPPNIVTYDTGTNFDFTKFCAEAKILGITYHQIFIEAHLSIKKVEKYHVLIYQVYDII